MPRAEDREIIRRWTSEPAVRLWALFTGDLPPEQRADLTPAFGRIREDGGQVALVASAEPGPREADGVDHVVRTDPEPSPFGLFAALDAAGVDDVRRLGVLGASVRTLEVGHRAGAGAIVGIAAEPGLRACLLPAQPDTIVEPAGFSALYEQRYGSNRPVRERVLLNPGPSVVGDRVHRAIAGPDLCHREPEYAELAEGVRRKLLSVAQVPDDWDVALLAGSGTAAMEAMIGSAVRSQRSLLVCRNGVYGERLRTMAARLGIPTIIVDGAPTRPIDPAQVGAALGAHTAVDAVAVVHHETTTGVLNPVVEIAAVAAERRALVLVDAISSFPVEDLPLPEGTVDFVAGSANKCLHGLPGAAFVLLSPRAQRRVAEVPARSVYLDLGTYLRARRERSVPFTPAIPAVMALDAALDELLDEGIEGRRRRYRERMAHLEAGLEGLGLTCVVAPEHRSSSVRTLRLPPGTSYEALHDALRREGFVIYAGLDPERETFRICTLGELGLGALDAFLEALARVLHGSGALVGTDG